MQTLWFLFQSGVSATSAGWVSHCGFFCQPQKLVQRAASASHSSTEAVALSTQLSDESWITHVGRCDIFHTTQATFALSSRWNEMRRPAVSGPDNDRTIFPTSLCGPKISGPHNNWSLPGPEISGPENDQIVWLLSGPGRCLVLLHRHFQAPGSGHFRVWAEITRPRVWPFPVRLKWPYPRPHL